ncbi:MAG: phosphotransferase, partial [Actinomycetota bacterium]|nr:phosphotransferase [Actinomycetota bacterium]
MDFEIPISLDDFTAQWLTTAFEHNGRGHGPVTEVRAERIAVGEGFLGELARLYLSYDEGNEGPQTVIAKIPTTDGALKPLGVMLGVYERESLFYEQVASKLEIRIPEAYFNGRDSDNANYALLLEDVGHYRPGDHLAGANLPDAVSVMETAANIHARWWDSEELTAMEWVPPLDSPINMGLQGLYEQSWPTVMDTYGHLYPDWLPPKLEEFIPEVSNWLISWAEQSRTLTHNDFRLDNLLFDDAETVPKVVVIDFQLVGRGDGSGDIAPFLGCNLDIDL